MVTVQIPVPFLKGLTEKPGYTDVWIRWITKYGEQVKDPFFLQFLAKDYPGALEGEQLQWDKIYRFGQPFLQALYFGKVQKETKRTKIITENLEKQAVDILNYLNVKCGTEYGKRVPRPSLKPIIAVLRQGYTREDCAKVIDNKYLDWHGGEMEQYLNPFTLFGKKFDIYLNQQIRHGNGQAGGHADSHFDKITGAVEEAIARNHEIRRNQGGEATD